MTSSNTSPNPQGPNPLRVLHLRRLGEAHDRSHPNAESGSLIIRREAAQRDPNADMPKDGLFVEYGAKSFDGDSARGLRTWGSMRPQRLIATL